MVNQPNVQPESGDAPVGVGVSRDLPVPTIDLDTTSAKELVGHLSKNTCVIVTGGHGVSPELARDMFGISRQFFNLTEEEKENVKWDGQGEWLGWLPIGSTDVGTGAPLLVEKFELNLPNVEGDKLDDRSAQFGYWPSEPSQFRRVWEQMYVTLGAMSQRIVTMIIEGLDLPRELVPAWTTDHFANMVMNNYVPQENPPEEGQTRQHPHIDFGGITVLSATEAPGGLEVNINDEWVPVALPPNAYLIQAGELLRRWTNEVIPGNFHRVVNPPREVAATAHRMSLVYFHYPELSTVVEPAPSCIDSETVTLEPMISGAHIMRRQRGGYQDEQVNEFAGGALLGAIDKQ